MSNAIGSKSICLPSGEKATAMTQSVYASRACVPEPNGFIPRIIIELAKLAHFFNTGTLSERWCSDDVEKRYSMKVGFIFLSHCAKSLDCTYSRRCSCTNCTACPSSMPSLARFVLGLHRLILDVLRMALPAGWGVKFMRNRQNRPFSLATNFCYRR